MYPRGLQDPDYCSIVNQRHYGRLVGYLEQAVPAGVARGAAVRRGRARRRVASPRADGAGRSAALARRDARGNLRPGAAGRGYDEIEEAIAYVNAQPRPLALYWFDDDAQRAERALKQTHAGGVCVNETLMHVAQEELPFGGVGPSGMGHYHGKWGFDTFSKLTPGVPPVAPERHEPLHAALPADRRNTMLRLMKRF